MPLKFAVTPSGSTAAEVSTPGECGRAHSFQVAQGTQATEPNACACGALMLVGHGVSNRLFMLTRTHPNRPPAGYSVHRDIVQLPWGESVEAAVAVPKTS